MDPVTGQIITAGIGAGITGLFNQSSANQSMDFSKHAAKNAHQWEVEDLRKAGLNPILSAHGAGARPSGGAQATMPDLGATLNTAQQVGLQEEKQEYEIQKIVKDIEAVEESIHLSVAQQQKLGHEINQIIHQIYNLQETTKATALQNVQQEILAGFYESYEWARILKEFNIDGSILKAIIDKVVPNAIMRGKNR